MGYVKILVVLGVIYLVQGYYLTRPAGIQKFIEQHNLLAMKDINRACDQYDDKVEVSIYFNEPNNRWEVEGGKNELCGYMQKGQAVFVLTDAQVTTSLHDMKVTPSGFPFMRATASYRQISEMIMKPQGSSFSVKVISETDDKLEIKRTLTGLKITKVISTGKSSIKPI